MCPSQPDGGGRYSSLGPGAPIMVVAPWLEFSPSLCCLSASFLCLASLSWKMTDHKAPVYPRWEGLSDLKSNGVELARTLCVDRPGVRATGLLVLSPRGCLSRLPCATCVCLSLCLWLYNLEPALPSQLLPESEMLQSLLKNKGLKLSLAC